MGMDKTQKIKMPMTAKTIPMICSWCKKLYDYKTWQVDESRRTGVSHGMCQDCLNKQNAKIHDPESRQNKKDKPE
ncbi:MAG: hypothetical protein A2017_03840 [Lentisphaerae bacterium GWF2_44_16]|nr:MAG: hypothetical protein A2017_03840 [Lentisphaerae bacterium GWF2_44_16]